MIHAPICYERDGSYVAQIVSGDGGLSVRIIISKDPRDPTPLVTHNSILCIDRINSKSLCIHMTHEEFIRKLRECMPRCNAYYRSRFKDMRRWLREGVYDPRTDVF